MTDTLYPDYTGCVPRFEVIAEPEQLDTRGDIGHLLVELEAADVQTRRTRPPLALSLVIDRSGSMRGEPLALASEAAVQALQLLRPDDSFNVVWFDSEAELVMAHGAATATRIREATALCRQIRSGGNTHLSAGWQLGCDQLREAAQRKDGTALCLLLSDGQANAGETSAEVLAQMAARARRQGIATSCIGLGRGFDEALLDGMARAAEGRFYFAERPTDLPPIFASEVGDALEVVAPAAHLQVVVHGDNASEVELLAVSAFHNRPIAGGIDIALGDLCARQLVAVVIEVRLPPARQNAHRLLEVRLRCGEEGSVVAKAEVTLTQVGSRVAYRAPRNGRAWQAIAAQRLHRARLEALRLNQMGEGKAASEVLLAEATTLETLCGSLADVTAPLCAQLRQEAKRLLHRLDELSLKLAHAESSYAVKSRSRQGTSLKSIDFDRYGRS